MTPYLWIHKYTQKTGSTFFLQALGLNNSKEILVLYLSLHKRIYWVPSLHHLWSKLRFNKHFSFLVFQHPIFFYYHSVLLLEKTFLPLCVFLVGEKCQLRIHQVFKRQLPSHSGEARIVLCQEPNVIQNEVRCLFDSVLEMVLDIQADGRTWEITYWMQQHRCFWLYNQIWFLRPHYLCASISLSSNTLGRYWLPAHRDLQALALSSLIIWYHILKIFIR